MTFFVKHPPEGDEWIIPNDKTRRGAYTFGTEREHYDAASAIESYKWHFEQTGNPLFAMEAFRVASAANLYPPLWVIKFIDERFQNAITNKVSLDRAFGFSASGLGKGNRRIDPAESARLRNRDFILCKHVFKLEAAGLTRSQACNALSKLLARIPDGGLICLGPPGRYEYALGRMKMTGRGIEKAVNAAAPMYLEDEEIQRTAGINWSDNDKRALLDIFNAFELPRAIVQKLGLKHRTRKAFTVPKRR